MITTGIGRSLEHRAGGLDPVQAGHLDVQQRQIGRCAAASSTASQAVAGLGHHLESGPLEHRRQVEADDRLVLGDQDSAGNRATAFPPPSARSSSAPRSSSRTSARAIVKPEPVLAARRPARCPRRSPSARSRRRPAAAPRRSRPPPCSTAFENSSQNTSASAVARSPRERHRLERGVHRRGRRGRFRASPRSRADQPGAVDAVARGRTSAGRAPRRSRDPVDALAQRLLGGRPVLADPACSRSSEATVCRLFLTRWWISWASSPRRACALADSTAAAPWWATVVKQRELLGRPRPRAVAQHHQRADPALLPLQRLGARPSRPANGARPRPSRSGRPRCAGRALAVSRPPGPRRSRAPPRTPCGAAAPGTCSEAMSRSDVFQVERRGHATARSRPAPRARRRAAASARTAWRSRSPGRPGRRSRTAARPRRRTNSRGLRVRTFSAPASWSRAITGTARIDSYSSSGRFGNATEPGVEVGRLGDHDRAPSSCAATPVMPSPGRIRGRWAGSSKRAPCVARSSSMPPAPRRTGRRSRRRCPSPAATLEAICGQHLGQVQASS